MRRGTAQVRGVIHAAFNFAKSSISNTAALLLKLSYRASTRGSRNSLLAGFYGSGAKALYFHLLANKIVNRQFLLYLDSLLLLNGSTILLGSMVPMIDVQTSERIGQSWAHFKSMMTILIPEFLPLVAQHPERGQMARAAVKRFITEDDRIVENGRAANARMNCAGNVAANVRGQ